MYLFRFLPISYYLFHIDWSLIVQPHKIETGLDSLDNMFLVWRSNVSIWIYQLVNISESLSIHTPSLEVRIKKRLISSISSKTTYL